MERRSQRANDKAQERNQRGCRPSSSLEERTGGSSAAELHPYPKQHGTDEHRQTERGDGAIKRGIAG